MLNYLWSFMILAGMLWGAANGNLDLVTQGLIDSAKDAVTLGITMLGIMSFWCGILEVGNQAGLIEWLTGKMEPLLGFLFPDIGKDHPARRPIAVNMVANMLGLGMAATPAGLEAMQALCEDAEGGREAVQVLNQESNGGREATQPLYQDKERGRVAMQPLYQGKEDGRVASNAMCTFLILNISSLQLIPVNMIAYRSQYGSVNPAAVLGPALIATTCSTLAAVVFCKLMDWRARR